MLNRFHRIPERNGRSDTADGQTNRITILIPRVNMMTRDKNNVRPCCHKQGSLMRGHRRQHLLWYILSHGRNCWWYFTSHRCQSQISVANRDFCLPTCIRRPVWYWWCGYPVVRII